MLPVPSSPGKTPGVRDPGDADAALAVFLPQPLRQSRGFLAEHQRHVPAREIGLGIGARGLGRGEKEIGVAVFGKIRVQVLVDMQIDQVPVIQPAALDRLVGDIKAQRFNEMQSCAGGGAGARDRPRVVRDLRLHKNDVQHPTASVIRITLPSSASF